MRGDRPAGAHLFIGSEPGILAMRDAEQERRSLKGVLVKLGESIFAHRQQNHAGLIKWSAGARKTFPLSDLKLKRYPL